MSKWNDMAYAYDNSADQTFEQDFQHQQNQKAQTSRNKKKNNDQYKNKHLVRDEADYFTESRRPGGPEDDVSIGFNAKKLRE